MKPFLTFGVCAFCALGFSFPAAAQHGGRSSALGGPLAPQGALSHPLGGFTGRGPGFGAGIGVNRGFRGNRFGNYRGAYGYPWGYSYYVPGYFDYLDTDSYPAPYSGAAAVPPTPAYAPAPGAPQQPVIINQYFGAQGPESQENNSGAPAPDKQRTASSGAPENYYLIAYKNHAIYSALAYWVEDRTLHYVTTQNTHNQASLDLIDLNLTKTLNQSNDVPFTLPGQ
ncbi:MAG TPA: hypothetical protein VK789_28505 [Bryobacteraceae bacterium]|nr:hypothetical protein [Bryobacteraceae bacterium]